MLCACVYWYTIRIMDDSSVTPWKRVVFLSHSLSVELASSNDVTFQRCLYRTYYRTSILHKSFTVQQCYSSFHHFLPRIFNMLLSSLGKISHSLASNFASFLNHVVSFILPDFWPIYIVPKWLLSYRLYILGLSFDSPSSFSCHLPTLWSGVTNISKPLACNYITTVSLINNADELLCYISFNRQIQLMRTL